MVRVTIFRTTTTDHGNDNTRYAVINENVLHAVVTHLPEVVLIETKEMVLQNFDLFEYSGVHESASIHPQLNLPHR